MFDRTAPTEANETTRTTASGRSTSDVTPVAAPARAASPRRLRRLAAVASLVVVALSFTTGTVSFATAEHADAMNPPPSQRVLRREPARLQPAVKHRQLLGPVVHVLEP